MPWWSNKATQILLAYVERIMLTFIYHPEKHLKRRFFARIFFKSCNASNEASKICQKRYL